MILIIPILDECVLFIKEYAAGVDDYMITLPKGKIDDNEDMYAAANRELQEEVGYKSHNIKLIQKIYLAPGYISHVTNMMIADKLERSTLVGDEPEALEVHKIHISQINSFLKDYRISDDEYAKSLDELQEYLDSGNVWKGKVSNTDKNAKRCVEIDRGSITMKY